MLTAVASNNGINISTGSREPSQQTRPPDIAAEHFERKKQNLPLATQSVPLRVPRTDFILFFNESFSYTKPQVLRLRSGG